MPVVIDDFNGQYSFLSNFYPCYIEYREEFWPTTEHAFQAAKAVRPADAARIRHAGTPGIAKRMGRSVLLRPDWERIKDQIMLEVCMAKFTKSDMAPRLLETHPAILVEGNSWGDRYWGVDRQGQGQNKLGLILMAIREELKRPCVL